MITNMSDPVFHLDAVLKSKEEPEDFDGPLSLILQLLAKNKVEIKDIVISEILAQYIEYLTQMEEMDLEIASEFVAMASNLMYIKAKTLLKGTQDVEEMETLISSLEEQRRKQQLEHIKESVLKLSVMAERGEGIYTRGMEPLPERHGYDYKHSPKELYSALTELLGREKEAVIPPLLAAAIPTQLAYPVELKSDEILIRLRDEGKITLNRLLSTCRSRSELAASLMAILELYRHESVGIEDTEQGMMIYMSNTRT